MYKKKHTSWPEYYGIHVNSLRLKKRITELERANRALQAEILECKKNEEKLAFQAQLLSKACEAVFSTDTNCVINYWNETAEKLFGWTKEETLGRESGELLKTGIESTTGVQDIQKIWEKGFWEGEVRYLRRDGTYLLVDIKATVLKDVNEKETDTVTVTRDITGCKRAERALSESEANSKVAEAIEIERQRLFDVLDALPAMVCLLTPDYNYAFTNRKFREKFGELNGRHCYEYCFGLTKPCDFCQAFKVLETGQPHYWEVTTPDGSIIDVHNFPFTDVDGSQLVLEMDIDITERKKAEEALEKVEKARIKEIHHRIKNNLQVISSLLDLQAEKFSDEKVLEAFKESQNRVASMALIHEELHKGTGENTLDFAAYLQGLTKNLLSSYHVGNNGINLNLDLEQIHLSMDTAIPLGIIVNELVSNSLKHALPNAKKGEISITLKRTENFTPNRESFELGGICDENDFCYVLKVSDNGKGIPKEIDFKNC